MSGLRFSYNTNGLADHRLEDALPFLADCGYDGVSLALDHHHLDPFDRNLPRLLDRVKSLLDRLNLAVVIETGGRFVLDPRRRHEPTLLSDPGRERRVDFFRRAVDIAAALNAEAVCCWSGARPPGVEPEEAWRRLVDGCARVTEAAEERGVVVAFEPEPEHLVYRLDRFEELARALGDPERFKLTLDVGHCLCVGDEPLPDAVRKAGGRLANVHVEDMRRGVHEHLDFGEGDIRFPPVLQALREADYRGLVGVELYRHSQTADTVVPRAIRFLRQAERQTERQAGGRQAGRQAEREGASA